MARNTQKAQSYFDKGTAAMNAENYTAARVLLTKSLSFDKDNPDILRRLAQVYLTTGHPAEARELLLRGLKRRPNHPDSLLSLSQAQRELGEIDQMHRTLDKALAWDPTNGPCLHAKVMGYIHSGRTELAQETLDHLDERDDEHPLILMVRARLARTVKDYPKAIAYLTRLVGREDTPELHKRSVRFELGHCYDAMGEYDRAFESFTIANGGHLLGKVLSAEPVIEMWSREMLDSIPDAQTGSQRPVFIAGMPRSGTTLTEQVLVGHPLVEGIGECPLVSHMLGRKSPASLTADDTQSYAQEYLAHLDTRVAPGASRVIDKHMGAERTLGLISKMFPGASVIHCLRDPIDSCLSSYFQNFGSNVSYSRDLTQLGQQYIAHRKLMDHWHEVLNLRILTSSYERLVADFEPGARRLIDHIGLDFHEDCLRFHESTGHVSTASSVQVRRPIYQSSRQRWRHYEKHIGALIEALGPYAHTEPLSDTPTQAQAESRSQQGA